MTDKPFSFSGSSDDHLRRIHALSMGMVTEINQQINDLMTLRTKRADWGRSARHELERRHITSNTQVKETNDAQH